MSVGRTGGAKLSFVVVLLVWEDVVEEELELEVEVLSCGLVEYVTVDNITVE
jgi:hypothetical protein